MNRLGAGDNFGNKIRAGAGTPQVQYQMRGIRPTSAGDWAQFNVNFGVSSTGATMASVVQTNVEPKLAA